MTIGEITHYFINLPGIKEVMTIIKEQRTKCKEQRAESRG